jgi:hypothetical protein
VNRWEEMRMRPDRRHEIFVSDIDQSEILAGSVYRLTVEHPDGAIQRLEISEGNYRDLQLDGLGSVELPASHLSPQRNLDEGWGEDDEDEYDETADEIDEDEDANGFEDGNIEEGRNPVLAPWSPGKWYEPQLAAGVDWMLKQAPHGPLRRQVNQYRRAIRKHYGLETAIRYIDAGRAAAFVLGLHEETPELWRVTHNVVVERNGRVDLETVALIVDTLDTDRYWSIEHTIAIGSRIGGAVYRLRKLS